MQRKKLAGMIASKTARSEDLKDGFVAWVPRWRQWGITEPLQDLTDEVRCSFMRVSGTHVYIAKP